MSIILLGAVIIENARHRRGCSEKACLTGGTLCRTPEWCVFLRPEVERNAGTNKSIQDERNKNSIRQFWRCDGNALGVWSPVFTGVPPTLLAFSAHPTKSRDYKAVFGAESWMPCLSAVIGHATNVARILRKQKCVLLGCRVYSFFIAAAMIRTKCLHFVRRRYPTKDPSRYKP